MEATANVFTFMMIFMTKSNAPRFGMSLRNGLGSSQDVDFPFVLPAK